MSTSANDVVKIINLQKDDRIKKVEIGEIL